MRSRRGGLFLPVERPDTTRTCVACRRSSTACRTTRLLRRRAGNYPRRCKAPATATTTIARLRAGPPVAAGRPVRCMRPPARVAGTSVALPVRCMAWHAQPTCAILQRRVCRLGSDRRAVNRRAAAGTPASLQSDASMQIAVGLHPGQPAAMCRDRRPRTRGRAGRVSACPAGSSPAWTTRAGGARRNRTCGVGCSPPAPANGPRHARCPAP